MSDNLFYEALKTDKNYAAGAAKIIANSAERGLLTSTLEWLKRHIFWLEFFVLRSLARSMKALHLEKLTVYDFFDREVFRRMAFYIGHGSCYEAAAMTMFALKGNRKSRYCIIQGRNKELSQHTQHAFVEFRKFGIWWAFDPLWHAFPLMTRLEHNLRTRTRYTRIVSYDEFWSLTPSKVLYPLMESAETSHVFLDLAGYHCLGDGDTTFLFEKLEPDVFAMRGGKAQNLFFLDVYGEDRPISWRILREYLYHPRRVYPKRRTYRRALAHYKAMREATRQATALMDQGLKVSVAFTGLTTFKIEIENPPAA